MTTQTLSWHDQHWCLRRLPPKVADLLKMNPRQAFVAGGFIRACITGEPVNDVDIFAPSMEAAKLFANFLAPDQDRAKDEAGLLPGIVATDNAYTITSLRPVAQVIHRWNFNSPEECLDSFDFTIAQAAIWSDGENWVSLASADFYSDLAAKRLIYRSPARIEEVGGSMLRVLKFYQRGYRIPLDSLAAVIARLCTGVRWNEVSNGEDEYQVSKVICGLLREVDPNIDPHHLSHLPSKEDTEP